jgi:broad specificity phosphatase PhoE
MKISAVRHGQTYYNLEKRCQGRSENPMTPHGFNEAKAAAELLRGRTFRAVYCSPVLRTRQTAEIIRDVINQDFTLDERLSYSYGDFEDKLQSEIPNELFLDFCRNPQKYNAQTYSDMYDQARAFVADIKQKHTDNVLIITHGIIINIFEYLEKHDTWNEEVFMSLLEKIKNVPSTKVYEYHY